MFKLIFANRYAALAWVGMSLFAAAAFVSEGGGVEQLGNTAKQLRSQQAVPNEPRNEPVGEPEAASTEEEPAIEASESPTPEAGDIVTGEDGRHYRVVGTEASSTPAN